jgi:hypothetical protein
LLGVKKWKQVEIPEDQVQLATAKKAAGGINGKADMEGADADEGIEDGNYRDIFAKRMAAQKSELKKGVFPASSDTNERNIQGHYASYDDEQLRGLHEVERITRLFNLLSHDNIYISE